MISRTMSQKLKCPPKSDPEPGPRNDDAGKAGPEAVAEGKERRGGGGEKVAQDLVEHVRPVRQVGRRHGGRERGVDRIL